MQTYKNHRRYDLLYYAIILFGVLPLIIGSIINVINSHPDNLYDATLICLIAITMAFFIYLIRMYALKAQDRAIRAEENLRHYVLSGKPLDHRLRMSQVIALRFASDNELIALAIIAAKENMSPDGIKKSIKNWRGDYRRV